jgi:hypothetical protein
MPRKLNKTPADTEACDEKPPQQQSANDDIEKRDYYYDDSHGYQTYKGDEDDEQFESENENS